MVTVKEMFAKKTAWLILAFIIGLVFMFANEAEASTQMWVAPESQFIAGKHTPGTALMISEKFGSGKYEASVMLNVNTEADDNNASVTVQRVVRYKKFQMGIGASYWHNQTRAWNSNTTFALSLRWNFNDRWSVQEMHWSTGSSSSRNGGLDMLMIGYSF